jgi:hypothetical protein
MAATPVTKATLKREKDGKLINTILYMGSFRNEDTKTHGKLTIFLLRLDEKWTIV